MKPRYVVALLLCLSVAGTLAVARDDRSASAQATGDKPYAGTTLRLLAANHPWTEAVKPLLAEFTGKTGIRINLEPYGEDQLTQKLTTEFTAGSSDIDVFMQRPLQEARQYVLNKWYTDLNTFVKDAKRTPQSGASPTFRPARWGRRRSKGS